MLSGGAYEYGTGLLGLRPRRVGLQVEMLLPTGLEIPVKAIRGFGQGLVAVAAFQRVCIGEIAVMRNGIGDAENRFSGSYFTSTNAAARRHCFQRCRPRAPRSVRDKEPRHGRTAARRDARFPRCSPPDVLRHQHRVTRARGEPHPRYATRCAHGHTASNRPCLEHGSALGGVIDVQSAAGDMALALSCERAREGSTSGNFSPMAKSRVPSWALLFSPPTNFRQRLTTSPRLYAALPRTSSIG